MFKRLIDFSISLLLLLIFLFLFLLSFLVYLQDFRHPLYMPSRVGFRGRNFTMFKMRSMVFNADSTGVDSTSSTDSRITPLGSFIRRFKIDELTQLINVLLGTMSLVGPRPNVQTEVDLYTKVELSLLVIKPVLPTFPQLSSRGDVLSQFDDPDLAYNQYIRPYKSSLGLFYIEHSSVALIFNYYLLPVHF